MSKLLVMLLLASVSFAKTRKVVGQRGPAQDPPRFSPPRPPPLDSDFEDPSEDELENGDAPSRAMQPPAPPPPPPASNDFHPSPSMGGGGSGGPGSPPKLKFQVAEGEFYEKGKKRGRTPNEKRMPQGRASSGR